MMRRYALALGLVCMVGCGGGGDDDDDAVCEEVGGESCFVLPTAPVTVTPEGEATRAANLNCGPRVAVPLEASVDVSGNVTDYVTNDPSPEAQLAAFYDGTVEEPADQTVEADANGDYMVTFPAGTPDMMTVRIRSIEDGVDVIGYRVKVDREASAVTVNGKSLSTNSADQIEGLVGLVRDPANGIALIAAQDCDLYGIANAIGTLSSTSSAGGAEPTFVDGYTFYGAAGTFPVPVRRTVAEATADNGVIFNLSVPPGTYYAQVWGFLAEEDVAAGRDGLTLISEIEMDVVADAASGVFLEPTEGPL
jgi:hypothetical protein